MRPSARGKVRPGRVADHPPPSSAAEMTKLRVAFRNMANASKRTLVFFSITRALSANRNHRYAWSLMLSIRYSYKPVGLRSPNLSQCMCLRIDWIMQFTGTWFPAKWKYEQTVTRSGVGKYVNKWVTSTFNGGLLSDVPVGISCGVVNACVCGQVGVAKLPSLCWKLNEDFHCVEERHAWKDLHSVHFLSSQYKL